MAYEYVNIRTDSINNVKVPTKETLDARTIIESTLEPAAGADDQLYVYNIGLWQFPKTGFYKIKLTKVGALGVLLKLYARITKDDGTTPDDWDNNNLKAMGNASGDGLIEEIYAQVDYINDDKFTVYRVQFFNCFGYLGSFWVNTYDKTTQKWAYDYKHRVTADHVSNKLTLTKGDTTTKFDGSTAQTVSIPTKTSELTNDSNFTTQTDLDTVVSYSAQENITDEQRAQARTNIGAVSSSDLVQSDWNQNDTTAKDYVKNRPGAYFSGETIEITQSLENLTWHTQDTLKIAQIQRTDIPDELYENIPYEICWGNEKHYIKLTSIDGQLKFGDTNNEGMPVFTNYPFFIYLVPSNSLNIILPNTSTPPSSISIKFNQGLVKLSEGYIDQIPGKISLYNISSNICSVDTLEIGVIEDNKFYGVENNQIGYLPTSNGVSGGLALFSPIPPFNQARMTWSGANSLSQFLGNSKSFSGDFGNNEQKNVRYNQALSEIHRYSYTLDHCRATIGFASTDYYSFKLYCDTTTSTKAIPTAIGYTVKNNKVYQLKVTANNLSTNGQVDFVFTEFLDLDTIASKSDIPIIDTALSSTSENPVQNNVINTALKDKLQYKGNWQSNTTYNKNDVVYDETDLMYVYTETDATSDPPDINPNCQPLVNIATNVKKGTLGVPNASTIYSQFNYLIDASTTDSGKYLTVNSEGNPEWGTITAPEESVVIAKLTGAGTTASPYACDKTYNELYTAILAGKYVLMYDSTTKRMLSPYFINIQARLLQFQHVLYEQTGSTTTTSKLTAITVNYNGGSNTLTRTVYNNNIVSSVNGKTGNVITLSASDVGAASSEDLNTLKNSIPEISVVTLDD